MTNWPYIPRDTLLETWKYREGRRPTLVFGPRGSGKTTEIDRLCSRLETDGVSVVKVSPSGDYRLTNRSLALWCFTISQLAAKALLLVGLDPQHLKDMPLPTASDAKDIFIRVKQNAQKKVVAIVEFTDEDSPDDVLSFLKYFDENIIGIPVIVTTGLRMISRMKQLRQLDYTTILVPDFCVDEPNVKFLASAIKEILPWETAAAIIFVSGGNLKRLRRMVDNITFHGDDEEEVLKSEETYWRIILQPADRERLRQIVADPMVMEYDDLGMRLLTCGMVSPVHRSDPGQTLVFQVHPLIGDIVMPKR